MVVNDVGKVIGRQFVGTLIEHFVIQYVALHLYFAAYEVIHAYLFARLNLESHHVLLAVSKEFVNLFL